MLSGAVKKHAGAQTYPILDARDSASLLSDSIASSASAARASAARTCCSSLRAGMCSAGAHPEEAEHGCGHAWMDGWVHRQECTGTGHRHGHGHGHGHVIAHRPQGQHIQPCPRSAIRLAKTCMPLRLVFQRLFQHFQEPLAHGGVQARAKVQGRGHASA